MDRLPPQPACLDARRFAETFAGVPGSGWSEVSHSPPENSAASGAPDSSRISGSAVCCLLSAGLVVWWEECVDEKSCNCHQQEYYPYSAQYPEAPPWQVLHGVFALYAKIT
jgi:hypothetical protein